MDEMISCCGKRILRRNDGEEGSLPVSDELEVLQSVTARLEGANIPYMVTGSMAANFYAVPRMTRISTSSSNYPIGTWIELPACFKWNTISIATWFNELCATMRCST
jgi:hypothetical protein